MARWNPDLDSGQMVFEEVEQRVSRHYLRPIEHETYEVSVSEVQPGNNRSGPLGRGREGRDPAVGLDPGCSFELTGINARDLHAAIWPIHVLQPTAVRDDSRWRCSGEPLSRLGDSVIEPPRLSLTPPVTPNELDFTRRKSRYRCAVDWWGFLLGSGRVATQSRR